MLWRLRKPTRDKLRIASRLLALMLALILCMSATVVVLKLPHEGYTGIFMWSMGVCMLGLAIVTLMMLTGAALMAAIEVWPTIEERWREEIDEGRKEALYEYDVAKHEYKRV